jgi:hypothetical protein
VAKTRVHRGINAILNDVCAEIHKGGVTMGTKKNPGAFDCYAKAEPDEPTFTLLGRDPAAALTIRYWVSLRRFLSDPDPEQLAEAEALCQKLEDWATDHGKSMVVGKLRSLVQSG